MTIEEAREVLAQAGVADDLFVLEPGSANASDFFGIEYEGPTWFVYYSERGQKRILHKVMSQEEATKLLVAAVLG